MLTKNEKMLHLEKGHESFQFSNSIIFFVILSCTISTGCLDVEDFNFNACSSNCVEINGHIIDLTNGKDINNAKVNLTYQRSCYSCKSYDLGEVTTDDLGRYSMNFTGDSILFDRGYYILDIGKKDYDSKTLLMHDQVKLDSTLNVLTYLISYTNLNVKVSNKSPLNDRDEVNISFTCVCDNYYEYNHASEFEDSRFFASRGKSFKGKDVDETLSYRFPKGEQLNIKYKVKKGGNENTFLDSLLLDFSESSDYTIEY